MPFLKVLQKINFCITTSELRVAFLKMNKDEIKRYYAYPLIIFILIYLVKIVNMSNVMVGMC